MFIDAGFAVTRNNLYQTIPTLYKQWSLSLDIMPIGLVSGISNILHIGRDVAGEIRHSTPGISFTDMDTRLHIASAINGYSNYISYDSYFDTTPIPIGQWTRVEVSQLRQTDKSYLFSIRIAGRKFTELENKEPMQFSDVKVYTSDDFSPSSNAKIHNLKIETFPDDATDYDDQGTDPIENTDLIENLALIENTDHVENTENGVCYEISSPRIFSKHGGNFSDNQKSVCIAACADYKYAGVQNSIQCFCGDLLPPPMLERYGECSIICPGNADEKCGDVMRMNIYEVPRKSFWVIK